MREADNAPPGDVTVWTLATAGLDEAAVAPWTAVLDAPERVRAARFARPNGRISFVAAHALARAALAAAAGAPAAAFAFAAGAHGKPEALLGGRAAGLAFSLSHTEGMVGVAVARQAVGFDVEPLARRSPLAVARRHFAPAEIEELENLPPEARPERFLRLWTLKEAFVKATGAGLTRSLADFWFALDPPAIGLAEGAAERAEEWRFEQRTVGGFVAALAWRGGGAAAWRSCDSAAFDPSAVPSFRGFD